jgi:hypothetical protein
LGGIRDVQIHLAGNAHQGIQRIQGKHRVVEQRKTLQGERFLIYD